MGIRFRSYSVYGLGYCPIIIIIIIIIIIKTLDYSRT